MASEKAQAFIPEAAIAMGHMTDCSGCRKLAEPFDRHLTAARAEDRKLIERLTLAAANVLQHAAQFQRAENTSWSSPWDKLVEAIAAAEARLEEKRK